jgi:2-hydroxy-3-keto-5-methylthiopentenyl-1-phosphate phosphatase
MSKQYLNIPGFGTALVVANATERLTVPLIDGILVFQEDNQTLYIYLQDINTWVTPATVVGGNSFETFQTPNGTYPTASSPTDTMTFTSSDSTITITGNSGTDTIDFKIGSNIDAVDIADGSVTNTEFQYINTLTSNAQTQLNGKESTITAGTTSQYWRGDKTFQTLDTLAVPENTNLYFTDERSQDAVGGILTDTATVDFTYNDGANTITADVIDGSITNTKLSTVATSTFKGRTTAGTGSPEDLTVAQAKTLLNLTGTNSGDQTITLTGDVTGSGTGSFTTAIASGVIVNADVNASAAIAGTKIDPNFGSQNIVTTGTESSASLTVTGTGGNGFADLVNQSSAPATPTSAMRLYSDSSNRLSWKGTNGFTRTVDGTANTANRIYTLPDAAGTITLNDATQTLTNKTISGSSNTLSNIATSSITGFDEAAQDATGSMLSSTDLQYTDATPLLSVKKTVEIKVFDDTTTITTGDGKYIWVVPSQFSTRKILAVFATVTTVSSSGLPTIQIANITNANDVLSTAITIDASEFTSDTAATPAVVNSSNNTLATGDRIRVDVDVAGTGAKGLSVGLIIGV